MVSVVIPTYNRLARLHRVLEALAVQRFPPEALEVVAVSDGSTDGTDEYLRSTSVPLPVVVATQPNAGPAAARNRGVELATGRLVLFLDDDVVPSPELVAAHVRAHEAGGDRLVAIGPMLIPADGTLQPWIRWEQVMLEKQYDALRAGAWAATARQFYTGNASVARHHLVEAGGFDVSLRRAEDVELAYRLADRGLTFTFVQGAAADHHAERSFESWLGNAYLYGRSDVMFSRDRGQAWLLVSMREEFARRSLLTRLVSRTGMRHRPAAVVMAHSIRVLNHVSGVLRLDRIQRAALSGLYNLRYYEGVRDELGRASLFLDPGGAKGWRPRGVPLHRPTEGCDR